MSVHETERETPETPVAEPARSAMQELVEGNRRRRRVRFWTAIGAIPVALVAALIVVKILSMYAFAHQAIGSFVSGAYDRTVAAAEWQGSLNWFEPYKAHYNRGTGLAELGELDRARSALEEAVPLAPGLEVCAVRYNLATVIERQGDEATESGDAEQGQALYLEALETLAANPEDCRAATADEDSPDTQRPTGESLDELERRILEKLQQQEDQQPDQQQDQDSGDGDSEGGDSPEEQQPDDSQLDELERKMEEGAKEREERQQGQQGDEPGGVTDRPW